MIPSCTGVNSIIGSMSSAMDNSKSVGGSAVNVESINAKVSTKVGDDKSDKSAKTVDIGMFKFTRDPLTLGAIL